MKKNISFLLLIITIQYAFAQNLDTALMHFDNKRFEKAAYEFEALIPLFKENYGENDTTYYAKCLLFAGISFEKCGNVVKAENYYLNAKKVYLKEKGIKSNFYVFIIENLLALYIAEKAYEKELELRYEILEISKEIHGVENEFFGVSLFNIGEFFQKFEQYNNAINYYVETLLIWEKTLGKKHISYSVCLNNIGLIYMELGKYREALPFILESRIIAKKTVGRKHHQYITSVSNLAELYWHMAQYDKALSLFREAIKLSKNKFGKNSMEHSTLLNNFAGLHKDLTEYNKALILYKESLDIISKNNGKMNPDYSMVLNNMGLVYSEMGQIEKALTIFYEALDIIEKTLGKDNPDYVIIISNMAELYNHMGQYDKALSLFLEAQEKAEKTLGKEHHYNWLIKNGLANLYISFGQFERAKLFYLEALKEINKFNPRRGVLLNNLALTFIYLDEPDTAYVILFEALENLEENFGKEHIEYSKCLSNISLWYFYMGNFEDALPFIIEALDIIAKTKGTEYSEYGKALNMFATTNVKIGHYNKALPMLIESLDIIKKTLGKENLLYWHFLNNLALLYNNIGQNDKVLSLFQEAIKGFYNNLNFSYSFLSEVEKEKYYGTVSFYFESYQSFFTFYFKIDPTVAKEAYNIELSSKSMILNSVINMRQAILSSGNKDALDKYDEWMMLRAVLSKQYALSIAESSSDLAKIEADAEKSESELTRLSSTFRQNKSLFTTKWTDVQGKLDNNEVAVEFSYFQYHNGKEWTDSTMYIALVLRPEDEHPHLVPLFEQKQWNALLQRNEPSLRHYINNLYRNKELYKLLWQPIAHLIPEGSTVYFAPSGSLHQIALAALAVDDTTCLSDIYNLVQLSTTAMLTQETAFTDTHIPSVALFGGINYEANENELLAFAEGINEDKAFITRGLPYDIDRGNTKWDFLHGSLKEVESIAALSHKNKTETRLYTGNQALEEQLKSLGGVTSPRIIHIATHGFFFPDPKKQYRDMGLISLEDNNVFKMSDNPLNRSGLLFAGSNNTWLGKASYTNIEDGILTSYEASNLNLSQTQLVVLSACETGLGDIKGSEGVFGLQRAFKAAGVEYIIMSLWKVPDTETAEFMTAFYENLFGGLSIPEAFSNTQTLMKNKYKHEPFKWAGFVLMK